MGGIGVVVFCKVVDGVCVDVEGDTSGGEAGCNKKYQSELLYFSRLCTRSTVASGRVGGGGVVVASMFLETPRRL